MGTVTLMVGLRRPNGITKILWNSGLFGLLFGTGPGSTTFSRFDTHEERESIQRRYNEFQIGYGLTTMTKIALEFGVLGVVAYSLIVILLARMCWRYYSYENDPYWKAFAAGSVGFAISMLFFSFSYHWTAFWGDTLPALYFYAMAVVYTRLKELELLPFELSILPMGIFTTVLVSQITAVSLHNILET